VPVWWTIWFDAANVALIGAGLASTVLAFTVACRSLPKELAGTAVGFVNFAGVVTGAALQVIPGLFGEWMSMDPLFELQLGSGTVFTIALTTAIVATLRLPRDHATR
jgi:sugar phosphate permease